MTELSTVVLSSHDHSRARIPFIPAEFRQLAKQNKIGEGKEHPIEAVQDYIFLETVFVDTAHTYLNGGHLKSLQVDNATGTCAEIAHKHKSGVYNHFRTADERDLFFSFDGKVEIYKAGEPEGVLEDEFKVVSNVANAKEAITLNYCRDACLKQGKLYYVNLDDNLVCYDTNGPQFTRPELSKEIKGVTLAQEIENFAVRRDQSIVTVSRKGLVQLLNSEGRVLYSSTLDLT